MENEVANCATTGAFVGGVVLAAFIGFLANRAGFLSVHKRAPKEPGSGGSGGGGGRNGPGTTHPH